MTDKELKRLSRGELLELLIAQMAENEKLKQDLESAQAALQDKRIVVENAGSLADAAMQLNGVFDAAQAAAQQYLENLRLMSEQQGELAKKIEADAKKNAAAILSKARAYCEEQRREAEARKQKLHEDANAYAEKTHADADAYVEKTHESADAYAQKAKEEADMYWQQVRDKVTSLLREQEGLRGLLQYGKDNHS